MSSSESPSPFSLSQGLTDVLLCVCGEPDGRRRRRRRRKKPYIRRGSLVTTAVSSRKGPTFHSEFSQGASPEFRASRSTWMTQAFQSCCCWRRIASWCFTPSMSQTRKKDRPPELNSPKWRYTGQSGPGETGGRKERKKQKRRRTPPPFGAGHGPTRRPAGQGRAIKCATDAPKRRARDRMQPTTHPS